MDDTCAPTGCRHGSRISLACRACVITYMQDCQEGWFINVIFGLNQGKWGIPVGRHGENAGADPVVAYICSFYRPVFWSFECI